MLMQTLVETVGYIGRAMSANENPGPYALTPYIIQSVLLLVAPALFAASIYMALGRIVQMIDGERALFIRRTWLTKLFVAGDVLSFLMQSSGAGLLSSGDGTNADMANNIIIGGLVVQVVVFALFVMASAIFHWRIRVDPTTKSHTMPWEKHMISLYIVSILIFVRSIVRLVEYAQGHDGYIMKHEIFLYVFDALVMWMAMVVMNWIHPSEVAACLRGGKAFVKAWEIEDLGYTGRLQHQ